VLHALHSSDARVQLPYLPPSDWPLMHTNFVPFVLERGKKKENKSFPPQKLAQKGKGTPDWRADPSLIAYLQYKSPYRVTLVRFH
jgi:hypothetical protein